MAKRNVFTCDVCGKDKQIANHWWMVDKGHGAFLLYPWDDDVSGQQGLLHLCGESCVTRAVSEYLSKQTKEAVSK